MVDESLPPLDIESSIRLIHALDHVRTLRELGIVSWWLFGNCAEHQEFARLYLTPGPRPDETLVVCEVCERAGTWPRQFAVTRVAKSSL